MVVMIITKCDSNSDNNNNNDINATANLRTNIMGFRGFDSSVILILRGGIPRPIGNILES